MIEMLQALWMTVVQLDPLRGDPEKEGMDHL